MISTPSVDVDLSIFVPVAPGTRVDAPLEIVELPERDCPCGRVVGSGPDHGGP